MEVQVKIISKNKMKIGEGPHWDEKTQSLYFTDVLGHTINKYDSKTGSHTQAKLTDSASIIIPVKNEPNKFLITLGGTIGTIIWDGVSESVSDLKVLHKVNNENPNMKTNDGKVSPSSDLVVGTLSYSHDGNSLQLDEETGYLYSFKNLKPKTLRGGISISNGLAWSLDEKTFYFIDSHTYKILSYQYDKETTEITNEKIVFDLKKNNVEGLPDGMTIDTDGNLWVACYNGSQVINIDPREGKLLRSIKLPSQFITSVAFGGPTFEDLYVTSGSVPWPDPVPLKEDDGCTFVITGTGARGLPASEFHL